MENTLQLLRQKSGLSLVEVATRTGIPVREIVAAEHDKQALDATQLARVSTLYEVTVKQLTHLPKANKFSPYVWMLGLGSIFIIASSIVMLGGSMFVLSMPAPRVLAERNAIQLAGPADGAINQLRVNLVQLALSPDVSQKIITTESASAVQPLVNVASSHPLAAIASKRGIPGAPFGCPVRPLKGKVIMTQGYGVGTHAPASIWGAVDLAVDSSGDGNADPSDTLGAPIVALHSGIARVVPNNWLAGNYVRITDQINGWATAYAHLRKLNIVSGQQVEPGMIIGWVGETGYASGPHLHYEIYQHDVNVNPLSYLECW
ncbi:MAG: peptidoglycan DD-metalloendopeptidase family protein [Chloroflexales bacterium]|nr:peptidoglycan DD-metalloendopeptidase family protein [Chloroflexales bacterium]